MVPVSVGHEQVPGTVSSIIVESDPGAIKVQFDPVVSGDLNHRQPGTEGEILSLTMDGTNGKYPGLAFNPDDLHFFASLFRVSRDRLVDEREGESCEQSTYVGPVGDIGVQA